MPAGQRPKQGPQRGGGQTAQPVRSLPLYRGAGFFARSGGARGFAEGNGDLTQAHPGLVFDKYLDTWSITNDGKCKIQDPAKQQNAQDSLRYGSKRACMEETIALYGRVKDALEVKLKKALDRESKLIKTLHGQFRPMKTDWRLVSGLGNGHPFETGFIWHRTLGVPYLPGSAVKGLIRA